MSFYHSQLKRIFTYAFLILALASWAVVASIIALRSKSEFVLIGVDANGTRVISSQDDPLFKSEVINFARRFFGLLYNFDSESFETNVGLATDLMSQELWVSQKEKITKLMDFVKTEKLTHSGTVQTITKLKDGRYQIVLRSSELRRMKSHDQDILISVSIKPTVRTKVNPWGMEVTSLEESNL